MGKAMNQRKRIKAPFKALEKDNSKPWRQKGPRRPPIPPTRMIDADSYDRLEEKEKTKELIDEYEDYEE